MNKEKFTIDGKTRFVRSVSKIAPSLFQDLVKVEELIVQCVYHDEHDIPSIHSFSGNTWRVLKTEKLLRLEENYMEIKLVIMAREFGKTDSFMYEVKLYSLKELEKFSIKLDYMSIHER